LTGLFLASVPIDVATTDTYFVVAHFHTIMVGGTVSAFMAGIHYWWPKVTGKMYNEFWAQFAAITMFLGFNLTFLPQFVMGWLGMPRRYHYYPDVFQIWHILSSGGAVILATAYIMPLVYLSWSLIYGAKSPNNPWDATGLEWQTPSPPPKQNFLRPPRVTADPYEYHDFGRAEETGREARARPQGEAS
jgi:cytochrome c oxidase subunit I